ncbi:MAG: carboxypeptidase-like regulatory domain-containing protein [Gemmatimonadaceae bacterium]
MQHPDEGTIHAWLDGALPADESARLEAHVAECAQCAAAVAEARGLIAASSRILSALDDVPGAVALGRQPSALGRDDVVEADVVPLRSPAPPVRPFRVSRRLMAAASVLLVVGVGSTLMFRGVDKAVVAGMSDARHSTDTSATSPMVATAPTMAPAIAPAAPMAAEAALPAPPTSSRAIGPAATAGAGAGQVSKAAANSAARRESAADSLVASAAAPVATEVAAADARAPVVAELRGRLAAAPPPQAAPREGAVAQRAADVPTATPQAARDAAAFAAAPGVVAGEIVGRVVDAGSGQALAGVDVSVVGAQRGTLSASDGTFRIPGVPAGPVQLQARRIGYQTTGASLAVPASGSASVELAMGAASAQLSQVVVTGARAAERRTAVRKDAASAGVVGCWELTRGPRLGGAASNRLRLDEGGGVATDGVRGAGTWTVSGDSLLIVVRSSADGRPVRLRLARTGDALRGTVEEGSSAVTARRVPCR